MAGGKLGRENLRRALDGFSRALAIDAAAYPEFVRDVIDNGRIQKFEYCSELFWKHLRGCLLPDQAPVAGEGGVSAGGPACRPVTTAGKNWLNLLQSMASLAPTARSRPSAAPLVSMNGSRQFLLASGNIVGRIPETDAHAGSFSSSP